MSGHWNGTATFAPSDAQVKIDLVDQWRARPPGLLVLRGWPVQEITMSLTLAVTWGFVG